MSAGEEHNMAVVLRAMMLLSLFCIANVTLASLSAAEDIYPLKVSSNKRYLVDKHNNPYLLFADTAWMLPSSATDADVKYYLDDRAAKGFNSILCYAAPWLMDYKPKCGHQTFVNNDLATPNDEFFSHVDWIIQQALQRNMQVLLCPAEMGSYSKYYTPENARALGRYLGKRYKDIPNIIWFTGGDITPTPQQQIVIKELAAGIREYDTNHLISMHPAGWSSSSSWFHDESWLGFNMIQSHEKGHPCAYALAKKDYGKTPAKPTVDVEPCYENCYGTTAFHVRQANGWQFFSGGCGLAYGAQYVYNLDYEGEKWKENLDLPGVNHLANMNRCIKARAWHKLVPDFNHEMLISGYGTEKKDDYVTAAKASDSTFGMYYMPSSRETTINMAIFDAPKSIRKFDPTNNTTTTIATSVPNSGNYTVAAPGNNSAGQGDWIIIIESETSATPASSATSTSTTKNK